MTPFPLLASLILAAPVPADAVAPLPTTPPPIQCLVSIDKEGRLAMVTSIVDMRPVAESIAQPDGKVVTRTKMVPVVSFRTQVLPLKDVQVSDTQGKPIDPKKLPELLKERVPALVSADGNKVDPLHLRIVKDGTLVFVVPGWQSRPVAEKLPE